MIMYVCFEFRLKGCMFLFSSEYMLFVLFMRDYMICATVYVSIHDVCRFF